MKLTRRLMALLLALSLLTGNVITPVLATETAAEPEIVVEEVLETVTEEEAEEPIDEVPDEEPVDEEPVDEAPAVNEAAATLLTADEADTTDATEETEVAGTSEANPLYPEWAWNDAQTEATATVTVPAESTWYVAIVFSGLEMTVNDGTPVPVNGSFYVPAIHTFINDSTEAIEYTLKLTVPVGSQMNPEVLEYGLGGYPSLAEGDSDGYYYTYTAEGTGYISLGTSYVPEGVEADIALTNQSNSQMLSLSNDGLNGLVTMAVTEGDVIIINVAVLPDASWNIPAADIGWTGTFATELPGTENNPIAPAVTWNADWTEATAEVTVPAGSTYWFLVNNGEYVITVDGTEVEAETAMSNCGFASTKFAITNNGTENKTYAIGVSYPVGSNSNPAVLADGETTVSVAEASNGYFFNYTAADRGTVTVTVDAGEQGWTYVINNMTSYAYGDTQWSDSDPVVNPAVVSVNKGDQLSIMVNTYDPANMWSSPAGDITVTVAFEAALGSESNPEMVTFVMDENNVGTATVTVPANTTYYCQAYGVGGMVLAINGEGATLLEGNPRMPASIVVTNDTDAEAVYTLTVSHPTGSQMNPEVLEYLGGNVIQEEGDSDGYYYTYTAESDGYLSAYVTYVTDGVAGNIILENRNTYEQMNMMYDGVNGMVTMTVTAGDVIVINVSGMPADGSWGAPAAEIGWAGAISTDLPGTENNPIAIDSLLSWNENGTEATATVTVPVGTSYFTVTVGGMVMSINGEGAIELEGNRWMPASFTIENAGTETADYVLKITYPEGTMNNPVEITDGTASIELAEGSQGYYYSYTAYERGDLTIGIAAADAEGNELGWTYVVNNMTSYIYGDTQWSDSDPVVNPYTVSVNKGDEIQIMVNTYDPDPANSWTAPAGTVTVTASFAPASGTEANPYNDFYMGMGAIYGSAPANTTVYHSIYGISGMFMTIENAANLTVNYNGADYTADENGTITVYIPESMMGGKMPTSFTVTNNGAEAAEYAMTFAYPVGHMNNPEALVLGDVSKELAEGSNGYYYTWTAEENGVLVITMNGDNWQYTVNNLTKGVYGDTQWSDEGSAVTALYVQAGDEIQIMVNTYDPANPWTAPAGTVSFNAILNPTTYEIASGKTLSLKLINPETGKAVSASKVNWEIAATYVYTPNGEPVQFEDASAYATLSAGKLKTKTCGDRVMMVINASMKTDETVAATYYVEIIPASTKLSIWTEGQPVVGTWQWDMNGITPEDDIWWDLDAYSYPSNASQDVQWTSSNKNIVTVDEEGVLRPVPVYNKKTGEFTGYKTGTVTITAKATDGSNKKASFKLTLSKWASYVEIVRKDGKAMEDITTGYDDEGNAYIYRGTYVDLSETNKLNLTYELDPNASKKGVNWYCDSEYAKISSSGVLTIDKKKASDGDCIWVNAISKDGFAGDQIIVQVINKAVSVNIIPDYANPNFVGESETKGILDVSGATTADEIPSLTLRGNVFDSNGSYLEDVSDWKASGSKNIAWEIVPYWESAELVDDQWVFEDRYDMENKPEGYPTRYNVAVTPKWNAKKNTCYTGSITLTGTASDGKTKASYKVTVSSLVSSLSIETKDGKNMDTVGAYEVWDAYTNWNPDTQSYEGAWYEGNVIYATAGQSVNLKAVTNANATKKSVTWWAYCEEFPDAVKISSSGKLTIGKDVPVEAIIWVEAQAKDNGYLYTRIPVIVTPRVTNVHISADFEGYGNEYYVSNTTKTWDYNDGAYIDLTNLNYPFDSDQEVKWSVSNKKIGYIEETTNDWGRTVARLYLTGTKFGKLTVTATAQDGSKVKSSFTLNVGRSVQKLYLYDNAVAAGKSLKLANTLGIDPQIVSNKKISWTMTLEDGSEVPKTVATLNKNTGVLTTKKAAAGTTVKITATPAYAYTEEAVATAYVDICTPTTSVDILDVKGVYSGTANEIINKKTVTTDDGVFFFGAICNPVDGSAGRFSAKPSNTKNFGVGMVQDENGEYQLAVVQIPDADGNVKYGKVKLTVKAEDGTGKNSYIYVNFVQPEPET